MVYGYRVKIPSSTRINIARSNGRFEYVYYTYGRVREKEKGVNANNYLTTLLKFI